MNTDIEITKALAAIPRDQVRIPSLPMPAAIQEASDLLIYCRAPHIAPRLIDVGQPEDFAQALELRIKVARHAQSVWVNDRDQTKSSDLVELETQAKRLRSGMMVTGRYNLKTRESQATLSQILGGDSVAELVQDLSDLSILFERNLADFDHDKSVDVKALIAESLTLAAKLSSGISTERVEAVPMTSLEMRDRAFTYLDDLVTSLRSAGRYAFRFDPATAKRFASKYRRRTRGKGRRAGDEESDPPITDALKQEVFGDQSFAG